MSVYKEDLTRGIFREIPVFRLLLGMCPTLGVSTLVANGLGMGIAFAFVLICSNVVVSAIRNLIPARVRIPCYIIVIATFVTIVEMVMKAFQPELHKTLGVFVPLIVVNCIILGRAEAFAGKRPLLRSFLDGVGYGIGFTIALLVLSSIRELFGRGTWLGLEVMGPGFEPMGILASPPGAFITLGLLLALINLYFMKVCDRGSGSSVGD